MTQEKLDQFGLTDGDLELLKAAGRLLRPELGKVLQGFYARALADPASAAFFTSDDRVAHARAAQEAHWSRLLEARFDAEYFASLDRIGRTHARIELPLDLYMSAYSAATSDLLERFLAKTAWQLVGPRAARSRRMLGVLNRAFALDIEQVTSITFRVWGEEQKVALDHLATGIREMAQGNLAHAVPGPDDSDFPRKYDEMRLAMNEAARTLETLVAGIGQSMGALQSITTTVAGSAEDLSRRTSSQAASLEETTAAMQMISESVRDTSSKTSETAAFFDRAQKEMRDSSRVAGDAADVMGRIKADSEKIAQIIGLIDDIAFQTNLLALNAGVEAARAGEAGRGFAVVAGEVRTLAANSSEAASEIRALIQSSSAQVNDGAVLVENARRSIVHVVDSFDEIYRIVTDISAATQDQSKGLDEISQSIVDLDRITQSNASMVEQTSGAMSKISAMTHDMQGRIAGLVYRSGEDAASANTAHGWDEEMAVAQARDTQDSIRTG
ncbi:globin-coupled sensor protein [Salipiger bermudensis]|uniref:globin-coupled sensor protein n=1 Tax=Salipiger bermudensis TaxID=344736 RepID=UPI001C994C50|nr:globin-coupled sensor protein [Salipiger bermudensis]MBY6004477.1 globin-coupled sensor protein [Salipiger bermudensis]